MKALTINIISVLFYASTTLAAPPGVPIPNGQTVNENITYSKGQTTVSESFAVPQITDDFGDVGFLLNSPIDSGRALDSLPSFGLAKFHWWLFGFVLLPRAQRQYADCVGQIKAYQQLLGISPLIDQAGSPSRTLINNVREYSVPFEAIQRLDGNTNLPPQLSDAIAHAKAALMTLNATVFNKIGCYMTAQIYHDMVKRRYHTR